MRHHEDCAPQEAATPPSPATGASTTDLSGGHGQVWASWRGREAAPRSPPCFQHPGLLKPLPGLPQALGRDTGGPGGTSTPHSIQRRKNPVAGAVQAAGAMSPGGL